MVDRAFRNLVISVILAVCAGAASVAGTVPGAADYKAFQAAVGWYGAGKATPEELGAALERLAACDAADVRRAEMRVVELLKEADMALPKGVQALKASEGKGPATAEALARLVGQWNELAGTADHLRQSTTAAAALRDACAKVLLMLAEEGPFASTRTTALTLLYPAAMQDASQPGSVDGKRLVKAADKLLADLEKRGAEGAAGLDRAMAAAGLASGLPDGGLPVFLSNGVLDEKALTDRIDRLEALLVKEAGLVTGFEGTVTAWKGQIRPYIQKRLPALVEAYTAYRDAAQVVEAFFAAVEKGDRAAAAACVGPETAARLQKAEPLATILGEKVRHVSVTSVRPNGQAGSNPNVPQRSYTWKKPTARRATGHLK